MRYIIHITLNEYIAMATTIKKGTPRKKVLEMMQELANTKNRKKSGMKNLCGAIKLQKDPLTLQKEWRNEW
ncbi:MAG: hypothetical protein WD491_14985 [Balneolales bacterium]